MVIRAGGEAGHGGNIVRGQRVAMGHTYGLVEHGVDADGDDSDSDLRGWGRGTLSRGVMSWPPPSVGNMESGVRTEGLTTPFSPRPLMIRWAMNLSVPSS